MSNTKIEIDFNQYGGGFDHAIFYLPSIPRLEEIIEFHDRSYRVTSVVWVLNKFETTVVRMKAIEV